jgi:hypothetical protein
MDVPGIKEVLGQQNWKDIGLPDIRDIPLSILASDAREQPSAVDLNHALDQVLNKHRHGMLVYQRCLPHKQKKQPD